MVTYTGEFFVQSCSSGSEAGKFDFGKWKKFGSKKYVGVAHCL